MKMHKKLLAALLGVAFAVCGNLNVASAADYWIWEKDGYNYYIVTEQSSLINDKSVNARMKEVPPNGKVYAYNLYAWEMKGVLWSSTKRNDVGTKNGRPAEYDSLAAKVYNFMMANY